MRKTFVILLTVSLLALLSFGCASNASGEQGGNSPAATPAQGSNAKDADQASAKAGVDDLNKLLGKEGWPKDKVPADLPEYTDGEVVNSGGGDDPFYIKIEKTNKEALEQYLNKLKAAGWSVTGSEAVKSVYSVDFTWQGGGSMLQMALYKAEIGAWPKDKIPPDVIQPDNCTFIGEIDIVETTENEMWYFNYTCEGIDEKAANAYMEMLATKGWSGDTSMVKKDFEWKGKQYSASIEIYEILDDTTTFTCNYYIAQ